MYDDNNVIIKAENICFTYDDGTKALQQLNLEVKRGRKVAFLGANGSGKSTFFLCLNGVLKPQSGTLYFNGIPYDYSKQGLLKLRSKVGIVFQDPDNQLFSASVTQEISFGILNLGATDEEAAKAVNQVMEDLEITHFQDRPTHFLSGGQKKQVSIADILVMNPDIIILDEPAAALDPKHTAIVNRLVDTLTAAGITIIISTHDVNYAYAWADDVVLFYDGSVLISGKPEDVFSNKRALSQTNLEQPAALDLFLRLSKKGILKPNLPLPRSLSKLEEYIEHAESQPSRPKPSANSKKAVLVVSFGTSFHETRKKTIDKIEQEIAEAYPDYKLYRAWTSKMIIKRLKMRDNISIPTVTEAMEQLISDGITDLLVQPTHIVNGIENDIMKEDVLNFQHDFSSLSFGDPLLTTTEDNEKVIQAVMEDFGSVGENEALVLMGHGTTHYANAIYAALDYCWKDMGYSNVFLGTVEAYPSIDTLLKWIAQLPIKKIHLAPFMVVAGDHATNDMSGDDEDSWKTIFERNGYEVICHMKGLGEYKGIRDIYLSHLNRC